MLGLIRPMFFWSSKIIWFLVHPMNLIFIGVLCVATALALRWYRSARFISSARRGLASPSMAMRQGDLTFHFPFLSFSVGGAALQVGGFDSAI